MKFGLKCSILNIKMNKIIKFERLYFLLEPFLESLQDVHVKYNIQLTLNSRNFGILKANAKTVTKMIYMAGWQRLIRIHSGWHTAKYLSKLTASVVNTEPTLDTWTKPYKKGKHELYKSCILGDKNSRGIFSVESVDKIYKLFLS